MKMVLVLLTLFYLLLAACEDLRTGAMDLRLFTGFTVFALLLSVIMHDNISYRLSGCLPGAFLLLVAIGTKEQIGKGDALVVMSLGFSAGLAEIMKILFAAWTGAFVTAVFLLIRRKKNKRFAFIPFLAVAYYLTLFSGLYGGLQ